MGRIVNRSYFWMAELHKMHKAENGNFCASLDEPQTTISRLDEPATEEFKGNQKKHTS